MGMAVLAGAAIGAVLLIRTDAVTRELTDDILPARVSAYQLQGALRDQETSLRGYVIAADRQFLTPYVAGERVEQQAAQDITAQLGDRVDLIADLTAIERAGAAWRSTYAQPLISSVIPGAPNVVNSYTADRGKAEFDQIRALFDTQNAHLAAARTVAVNELDAMRSWRDRVLIGMVAVFAAGAILLALLMRRAVTRPLAVLAASCRRIAAGNFAESIAVRGSKDIRAIAGDVENMRGRIVAELDVSRSDQARLAMQAQALNTQAVELRRSNAELEQFAYVASHDLQEPLRKVTSFCQLLEKRYGSALDERGIEYIGFAVDGAKRMQVLINDLLTFSRVGRLTVTHATVALDTTLDTALGNLAAAIEESGAQIKRRDGPLPQVTGDATLMTMLWQNLIGNAVKFRREDHAPRVIIDCERGTGDHDGYWVFGVTDNGIGIAPEFAEKVFVIFQRLHGRDAYAGTGIGLALCKKIVELHGGIIGIDTSNSSGTRFWFTLPITAASDETPIGAAEGAHR
ncbi:sensor histidine kinase [Mycobacterium sp.]|uniref:sensor histidine kinase n=1 Tax=Mycobacterium sp. TaxID=1785 RepID=UPI002B724F94|nr:CHASE3 domain-containing protein [Mycobacterium sp.]HXB87348.1 CHASE3 domain-containing protein [Mycobacterium sp.]